MVSDLFRTRKNISFDECMNIVNTHNNYDYIDEVLPFGRTRTFNYRLNIYENFLMDGARNLRGIVFDLDTKETLALPFFKFFNINENPFTSLTDVRKWKIQSVYEKVDGSLLYFYSVNGNIMCRTKRCINNDQTNWANMIVENNMFLKDFICYWIKAGYTPMFELLSPMNEHIVKYSFTDLCFLALRNIRTGEMHFADMDILPYTNTNIVSIFPIEDSYKTVDEIVNVCLRDTASEREDVLEGYTAVFDNGEIVKFKRLRYLELFRYASQAMNDAVVAELLLNEKLDDMLSGIHEKEILLDFVNMIIKCVDDTFNSRVSAATKFYRENRNNFVSKKDYVFAVKETFPNDWLIFSLSMNLWDTDGNPDLSKVKEKYIREKSWRYSEYYKPTGVIYVG